MPFQNPPDPFPPQAPRIDPVHRRTPIQHLAAAIHQTENDVEADCVQFLRARKWRIDRNNVGRFVTADGRTMGMGRRGQCDWRAVRRHGKEIQYFEFEAKATNGRLSPGQAEYIALLRHYGIPAFMVNSLDSLKVNLLEHGYLGEGE